ncbi:MAG: hypothetical protein BA873_15560 [Desulfobulbaceae bacterium C00003063]|nr:MAG: hypothetical protein BA873_15560 [Desulfobulbaceae bacterium C00003063]
MLIGPLLTTGIITLAESFSDIRAGITRLEDVLKGPSYQAVSEGQGSTTRLDDIQVVNWP